jgi:hypothetical protein
LSSNVLWLLIACTAPPRRADRFRAPTSGDATDPPNNADTKEVCTGHPAAATDDRAALQSEPAHL